MSASIHKYQVPSNIKYHHGYQESQVSTTITNTKYYHEYQELQVPSTITSTIIRSTKNHEH